MSEERQIHIVRYLSITDLLTLDVLQWRQYADVIDRQNNKEGH